MLVMPAALRSCHCCGLIQSLPESAGLERASPWFCVRCRTRLHGTANVQGDNAIAAALALAALLLFPMAIALPFLHIERLGQTSENSLLGGVFALFEEGHLFVGMIVLAFSIVLPPLKLSALLVLSLAFDRLRHHHRAWTYRMVEHLGRWGMMDVLFVALLVIFIKLGDLVQFAVGPGVYAFATFVLLSLVASFAFNPYHLWEESSVAMETAPERPLETESAATFSETSSEASAPMSADSPKSTAIPSAQGRKPGLKRWRWLWVLPAAAGILSVVMLARYGAGSGSMIEIHFSQGHGLKPGDLLNHRGIAAGKVEQVTLTDDLGGVEVVVRLMPEARGLACVGSKFWIVRPRLSLTSAAGLETIVGAKHLEVLPGSDPSRTETRFVGLDEAPLEDFLDPGGFEIVLQAAQPNGVDIGTPVYYRQIRIGGVSRIGLSSDRSAVEARVYVRPQYRGLIREQSRFWMDQGVSLKGGLSGFNFRISSFETLLRAGIAMSVPPDPGEIVDDGHRFTLHDGPNDEWLKWKPVLADEAKRPILPKLQRGGLRWIHPGLIRNSQHERFGWVLPIQGGYLGPANLLMVPEAAKPGTAILSLADRTVTLDNDTTAQPRGFGLAFLPVEGVESLQPGNPRRKPGIPEDCLIVSDIDRDPIFVSAARLTKDNDVWRLDSDLAFDPGRHGAAVVAMSDGAILGFVLVDQGKPVIAILEAASP